MPLDKDKIMKAICDRIAQGESLLKICKDKDMPARSTINEWLKLKPYSDNYAHARELWADDLFEQMRELIAIAPADQQEIARLRIMIDTIKWQLARMNSGKYGDKIQQDVTVKDFDRVVNIL